MSHYAVQWLGRFGRAYGIPVSDDSHTSLTWDAKIGGLVNGDDNRSLSHSLSALTLTLKDENRSTEVFSMDGRSEQDIRAWLGTCVEAIGLDQASLDAPLPYEIPGSPLSSGGVYTLGSVAEGASFLEGLYRNAAELLNAIKETDERARPIRCWPHHFDIATLIVVEPQTSEESKSIGVGMSPGDDTYSTPYFYITPWPYPDAQRLSQLPSPGHWHTEGWVGAILKVQDLNAADDTANTVSQFVSAALSQASALLVDP